MTGTVFNIQPYSLHDGPGIRTVVFLKGCPLRCKWCSNPESQSRNPQIYFDKEKCISDKGCKICEQYCDEKAVLDGTLDFTSCTNCLRCGAACPSKALSVYGRTVTAYEVISEAESQQAFYRHGDGGITLSGGEPLMQGEFAVEILKTAKRHRIHTAIETCGFCDTDVLRRAAEYLNYIMFDVKLLDEEKHIKYTGASNKPILRNLEMLFREFPSIPKLIRTPVIPTVNDNKEEISAIKNYLNQFDNYTYELLPYHRFGEKKYTMLGREYPDIPKKLDEKRFEMLKEV